MTEVAVDRRKTYRGSKEDPAGGQTLLKASEQKPTEIFNEMPEEIRAETPAVTSATSPAFSRPRRKLKDACVRTT